MNRNYRKHSLATVVAALTLSASAHGALITTTTNDAGGADAAVRATTPAVTEGNAATPVSFDAAGSPSAAGIGAIALRFNTGPTGEKAGASVSFVYRRNNSAGFTLYGVADSAAGAGWDETTLTADTAVANGWLTNSGTAFTPTASLVNLGTIGLTGTSANTVRTYPGGADAAPNAALDGFLSADTDGRVTFLLVPSSARSPFVYTREAAGTALVAPTLSFNANTDATPEPAALTGLLVAAAGLSRRRVRH